VRHLLEKGKKVFVGELMLAVLVLINNKKKHVPETLQIGLEQIRSSQFTRF